MKTAIAPTPLWSVGDPVMVPTIGTGVIALIRHDDRGDAINTVTMDNPTATADGYFLARDFELTKAPPVVTPTLKDVKTGDYVWIDQSRPYWEKGKVETYLATVTHVDKKGRMFMCTDVATMQNWRYGFDRVTGTAEHYKYHVMRFATAESIAEYRAELAAKEAAQEAERLAAAAKHRVREAAPTLLAACKAALAQHELTTSLGQSRKGDAKVAVLLIAAIAEAERETL